METQGLIHGLGYGYHLRSHDLRYLKVTFINGY